MAQRLTIPLLVFAAGLLLGLGGAILVLSGLPGSGPLDPASGSAIQGGLSGLALPTAAPGQDLTAGTPRIGQAAPDFTLTDLNGKRVRLSDFRGKPVLINFWATWCEPCKQEMPAIDAAYQAHKDQGLTVLAIEIEEPPDEVRQYTQNLKLTFTPLLDQDPRVFDLYRIRAMPTSFFVGRDGRITAVHFGAMTPQWMEDTLRPLLGTGSG